MAKPALEFTHVSRMPWTPVPGAVSGIEERILARDATGEILTRMQRYAPGCDTSPNGVQEHDFWEEIYVLRGELFDLGLRQSFGAGSYACRPPRMPHGPWLTPRGCVTFEVRYAATGATLSDPIP
jgi:hypothetical protein